MPAPVPESKEKAALDRLRMVRVAKDLFLSEWYRQSCRTLEFSRQACDLLADIEEESREERDEALDLIARWSRQVHAARLGEESSDHVAHAARRDFLLHLIDVKEASGEVFERAALLAPLAMKEDFERLAGIDFRHAVQLRQLLVEEVQEEWQAKAKEKFREK